MRLDRSVRNCAVAFAFAAGTAPAAPQGEPVLAAWQLDSRPDALLFDEPGDGALWVRGERYKAKFEGCGATVVPYLGSEAPRNFPLALRPGAATLGGRALGVDSAATPLRDGATVRIDRGAFVEEYALELAQLEQRFVFDELPGEGELVLRMEVASELAGRDLGTTLRFENGLGGIDYGQAYALDAGGARLEIDSTLDDGVLELRVPAEFVARATLPLTIDPLLTFFTASTGFRPVAQSDAAFDEATDRWCVVWTELFSATDHDIFCRLFDAQGSSLFSVIIDFSTTNWTTPRIASNNAANSFLVCASVLPASGVGEIRGRLVNPAGGPAGAELQLSPADGLHRDAPDVGGDPYPTGLSYYCVVWQRHTSASNRDIEMRVITTAGAPLASPVLLESSAQSHFKPRISRSNGGALWNVVWQYAAAPGNRNLYGAQITWSGVLQNAMFPISTAPEDETDPVPSTICAGAPSSTGAVPYLVVCQRDYGSHHDVIGIVLEGASVRQYSNLTAAFESDFVLRDQTRPVVESDGARFLVGYVERATLGALDANVFVSDLWWSGSTLIPCDRHAAFAATADAETELALVSSAASGGIARRYLGALTLQPASGPSVIKAGLWNACVNGSVERACAGDGNGALCPCGNYGAPGRGCPNSASPGGALLQWSGAPSLASDTLALTASGMPPNASCLFFQSTGTAAPFPFGDGLRCTTGLITRFPLRTSVGGSASYPSGAEPAIHVLGSVSGVGETRYYQAWYRDSAPFCTSATFNATNALRVVWSP